MARLKNFKKEFEQADISVREALLSRFIHEIVVGSTASGYRVLTLDSGDRAVEFAKCEKPDLILLDIMMPGKNGCDVCRELKADKATGGIPVVVFTAQYPEEEYIKTNSEEIGADDYILKPFDAQSLLAKIKFLVK